MHAAFRQPLIPAVLAYCAGCCTAHLVNPAVSAAALCTAAVLLSATAAGMLIKKRCMTAAFCILCMLFLAGFCRINDRLNPDPAKHTILNHLDAKNTVLEAVVVEPPVETPFRSKLKLAVSALHTREAAQPAGGNLLLSIKQQAGEFTCGDRILFSSAAHRPKNFSNPGGFDYIRHLAYKEIYATAFLENGQSITRLASPERGMFRWIETVRSRIRTRIRQTLETPARDVLLALIIGEQASIPDDLRSRFSALGITHILSISGLHVSIFALITYWLIFNLLKLYPRLLLYAPVKKIAVFLSIFPVLGYCLIAGMATPAARSGLMVACYLITLLLDRPQHMLHTLFVAAFAILAVSPQSLFEISFQLSFVAVFCLIVLVPAWKKLFKAPAKDPFKPPAPLSNKSIAYMKDSLLTSAAALLGTAPLVAYYFYTFAPSGFISNLIMVPLAGFIIVPIGLAGALFVFIEPGIANALFTLSGYCIDIFIKISDLLYAFLGEGFTISKPLFWEIAAFYCLLFTSILCRSKRQWLGFAAACLLFLGAEYIQSAYRERPDGYLRVTFLDVGAGDAAVLQFPDKQVMLIDGGGLMDDSFDTGKAVIAPFLYTLGIKKIDYIVMTHPHRDHAGGLPYIAAQFKMQEFWHNGSSLYLDSYQELSSLSRNAGARIIDCSGPARPRSFGDVSIIFLNPRETATRDPASANNDSLVMKISYGSVSFLFSGDILQQAEEELAGSGADLAAAVLKVPHHGGQSSTGEAFLNAVQPRMAIVSGRSFGRRQSPHPQVASRLQDRHIETYVTGQCGAITITTDGKKIEVDSYGAKTSL